jgi:transcription-repair coupling factor (superfamily II helicase)
MNHSPDFFSFSGHKFLRRAGMATRCKLAAEHVAAGGTAVLLVLNREEHATARALLRLFCPEMSAGDIPLNQPLWQRPVLEAPTASVALGMRPEWQRSLALCYALQQQRPRCIVLTVESLLLRLAPPDFFTARELPLQKNAELSPEMLLEQAIEWGYRRVPMVAKAGELARRGDIVDIFPTGFVRPVRLEFFGDTLEEIRLFDAESQRSLHGVDSFVLLPASPVCGAAAAQAAQQRWQALHAAGELSENGLYVLKQQWERGAEALLPGLFYEQALTLAEWTDPQALWFLPGSADYADALSSSAHSLKNFCEDEASPCPQPARFALRDAAEVQAMLEARRVVYAEPLVMGVEKGGEDMPEHALHSFGELFPLPTAQDRPWQHLVQAMHTWQKEKQQVLFVFNSERGRNKFIKLAERDGIMPHLRYAHGQGGLFALVAPFREGVELLWANTLVLGEHILQPKAEKNQRTSSRAFKGMESFDDLSAGDLLVHRDYGIGRFAGLHHLEQGEAANDYLLIEYSGSDKLYVPADRLGLIQRFKNGDGASPVLDRLGTASWSTGKEKAQKAIEKIAADLVEMYAWRKVAKGFRYDPPGDLYHEFEATFGFEETPDQTKAICDVLEDMEKPEPMDRLVCGDVGFGKTEVALRAAFRAAAEGRQVAMLCPTTVLAEQHYQTFRARLSGFPINVGLLSRFVSRQKQQEVLKSAAQGHIDILIGTHRLLSADVHLPNLTLLILDEEQRFGVRHKDKLKALKKNVDVLTLTATPIPRTLQLSMSGIRELSVIETAPQERKPVASALIKRDDALLRSFIQKEMAREGQVFWVYNRVNGLERVADYVRHLVPEARVGMAHGQMPEGKLEEAMHQFWHGELDVLVCTSIVESGLDFPRANTLIVDQAQMFGLGQLYQLRGRVGRSDRQAYAVFVVPDEERLTSIAEERLRIILDMDYLGAGFQVAMEDLRLRGAGNILGEVQTGHMSRVGLDLYLEMLESAVNRLKGMPESQQVETEVNLGIPAHIPEKYISDGHERLRCYKALTSAMDGAAREDVALGMRDRFGALPEAVQNFLAVLDLKQALARLQVRKADIYADRVRLVWAEKQSAVEPEQLLALVARTKGAQVLPPDGLELPCAASLSCAENLRCVQQALAALQPKAG